MGQKRSGDSFVLGLLPPIWSAECGLWKWDVFWDKDKEGSADRNYCGQLQNWIVELVLFSGQVSKIKMYKGKEGVSQNQGHVIPWNAWMGPSKEAMPHWKRGIQPGKFILHVQKMLWRTKSEEAMMDWLDKPPLPTHLGIFYQVPVAWKDIFLSSTQGNSGVQQKSPELLSLCTEHGIEWEKVSNWRWKALGPWGEGEGEQHGHLGAFSTDWWRLDTGGREWAHLGMNGDWAWDKHGWRGMLWSVGSGKGVEEP